MDANQESRENPFGMDENCQNCPALCETRSQVVHGYGDVGAEFVFLGESPSEGADRTGVPFAGDAVGEQLQEILRTLGFSDSPADSDRPEIDNVFLTYTARCRHPDRKPSDEEIANCEPYLNSELRMINPEIIVAVGQGAVEALAWEYTTRSAEDFDVEMEHATTIQGRGFEIVPMIPPADQDDDDTAEFITHMESILDRDYRQTKGRRGR